MEPESLSARRQSSGVIVIRAENERDTRWVEAEVRAPNRLSFAPDRPLTEGRLRMGIVEKDEALEKTVRVYTGGHTEPQEYVCKIVVFTYDKDAVIDERIELQLTVKCEEPEPAS